MCAPSYGVRRRDGVRRGRLRIARAVRGAFGKVLFSGAPPPPVPFFLALPEGAGGAFAFAGGRILICATGVVTPRTAIVAPRFACASLQGRTGNR